MVRVRRPSMMAKMAKSCCFTQSETNVECTGDARDDRHAQQLRVERFGESKISNFHNGVTEGLTSIIHNCLPVSECVGANGYESVRSSACGRKGRIGVFGAHRRSDRGDVVG